MAKLTILELNTADVFQDMVRVHYSRRPDVPAGRVCKMSCGGKSVLLVARGNNKPASAVIDLRTRNRLGISSFGQEAEVTFERASWFDEIIWGLQASEPISRIATRLGVISLALGFLGAVLGVVSLCK